MASHSFTALFVLALGLGQASGQQPESPREFGSIYAEMDPAQQRLIDDWVARFNEVTGQDVEAGPFYDRFARLSTKTTFDAVTHALMNTPLTDSTGSSLGPVIDIIDAVEDVRGKIKDARGDEQFRMYVRLKEGAIDTLEASQEFTRGTDNTVYHKGYPINYRQSGTVPSIQVSIALDQRRADIDVDYRSSSFPVALFNGHLSSSNSDVRAGDNFNRHNGRWEGFTNWWRSLFGARLRSNYADEEVDDSLRLPDVPRIGAATIEKVTEDFLQAWLVEGDVLAAVGYISERSYACIELEQGEPVDRGMAPYQLMMAMKAVKDEIGAQTSLEGVTLGVRLTERALKVVRQPHHARFVLYSIPDDVAQSFDCANRTTLATKAPSRFYREYGNYFAAVLFIETPDGAGETLALLWAKQGDYWKIISYESEPATDVARLSERPDVDVPRIAVDTEFSSTVDRFLQAWLIDGDSDAAFSYMAPESYSCYDLYRGESDPVADNDEQAGQFIDERMGRVRDAIGQPTNLDDVIVGVEPSHPMIRIMEHERSNAYALVSVPDVVRQLANCSFRASKGVVPDTMPADYGNTAGTMFRFRTVGGEAPVYQLIWAKIDGAWKISAYKVEDP